MLGKWKLWSDKAYRRKHQEQHQHAEAPAPSDKIFVDKIRHSDKKGSKVRPRSLEPQAPTEAELLRPHQVLPFTDLVQERKLEEACRNHGCVNLMKRISDGSFVAVKKMPNEWIMDNQDEFDEKHPKSDERPWFDLGVLRYLNERNLEFVCKLEGIFRDSTHTYIATEFADLGDLFDWSRRLDDDHEARALGREVVVYPVVRQVIVAVQWLHDHGLAHRDVSLENVVLSSEVDGDGHPRVRVIDFGMATTERFCQGTSGKASYAAPEMHTEAKYDAFLCDVFAVGVIIFCLCASGYPWLSTRPGKCQQFTHFAEQGLRKHLQHKKAKHTHKPLDQTFTPVLAEVLEGTLTMQPENRFSLGEVCYGVGGSTRRSVWDCSWMSNQCEI